MPKFFVSGDELTADRVRFRGENAAHLKVLRVRVGETLTVSDGAGRDYTCRLLETGSEPVAALLSSRPSPGEPAVWAAVYAALPKGDKAETIVQKCVELGAARVVFFASARCVSKPDEKAMAGKLRRYRKIAEEAAMQSYRGRVPQVDWLPSLSAALAEGAGCALRAFLWEEERALSLRQALTQAESLSSAALMTGPEGGFSAEEAAQAASAGFQAVTLGPRILRCETAPLAALTALMYHTGGLDAAPAEGEPSAPQCANSIRDAK